MHGKKKVLQAVFGSVVAEQSSACRYLAGTVCDNCLVRERAICALLEDAVLADLHKIGTDKMLAANEVLIEEGFDRKFVYTLRTGMLRLVSLLPDGRRQISGFLMPGDFVGLVDEEYYTLTVETVVPSMLCCFKRDALERVMDKYPKMREWLLTKMRTTLRHARASQLLLGRLTPQEKIANFLFICSRHAQENGLPANPVRFVMNRSDIADYLGLTVETVSRSLSRLKARGIIRLLETNLVFIDDMDTLRLIAATDADYAKVG